ncbi:MAG TPA: hypothetical protein VGJ00_01565 [Rhabdochlamydiaceae bacterium]|jgi:hypothetical protein
MHRVPRLLFLCKGATHQREKQNINKTSNHTRHFLVKKLFSIIGVLCFIFTVFLLSAYNKSKEPLLSACLTPEEKQDLDYFFRFLIYENYGAFVLFGSKPLCQMNLPDTKYDPTLTDLTEWIDAMPENDRKQFEMIQKKARERAKKTPKLKRNPYQGLLALEKVLNTFKMKNYILRIDPPLLEGDDQKEPSYEVMLINIQQTAIVMAENYTIFKEAAKMDFHPLEAVFELQNPKSAFWEKVFSLENHIAKGLLFGFGLKNSIFGNWRMSCSNGQLDLPSDNYKESIMDYLKSLPFNMPCHNPKAPFCAEPLRHCIIPLFEMVQGDEMTEKYTKEKAVIERWYNGKDFVEITLKRLAGLE